MSPLRDQLADYLAVRRVLGYRLYRQDDLLGQFIDYLEARGMEVITVDAALTWANLPNAGRRWHAQRLRAVRGFARHLAAMDVPVEVPPSDLLPEHTTRAVPYLYGDAEIAALIDAAGMLSSSHRVATFRTMIGVLVVTGMRRGEAIALDRSDFNVSAGVLVIRHGKFGKLRASELIGLTVDDVHLGPGAHVDCIGKGRKQRITPLTKTTVALLRAWLTERGGEPLDPLFPTGQGGRLSRNALERRLAKHAVTASERCRSLAAKNVTPHVLRLTAAMRLLHAGVEVTVIGLWLGHEQVETTNIYLHADLAIKEQALAKTTPLGGKPGRYRAPDSLLAFLEQL
jgi:integrase